MLLRVERVLRAVDPVEKRRTSGGLDEVEEEVDGRGLPGAVCPEEAVDLPGWMFRLR